MLWIVVPNQGQSYTPAAEAGSPNHRPTREVKGIFAKWVGKRKRFKMEQNFSSGKKTSAGEEKQARGTVILGTRWHF